MIDPAQLLHEYGPRYFPVVVFFCAIAENDITFVMAGIYAASARPHPNPAIGIIAGVLGALCHDSFWFFIGRHRALWIRGTPAWRRVGPQIEAWAERFGHRELFLCRFIPGTRNASLLFWGVQRMGVILFYLINATALLIWGSILTFIGYHFSLQTEAWLGRIKHKHLGRWLLLSLILTVVIYYAVRAYTRRRIIERGKPPSDPRAD